MPESEFAKVHNYIGNVLMALNASYAFLAASFSDLLTVAGFAIPKYDAFCLSVSSTRLFESLFAENVDLAYFMDGTKTSSPGNCQP